MLGNLSKKDFLADLKSTEKLLTSKVRTSSGGLQAAIRLLFTLITSDEFYLYLLLQFEDFSN